MKCHRPSCPVTVESPETERFLALKLFCSDECKRDFHAPKDREDKIIAARARWEELTPAVFKKPDDGRSPVATAIVADALKVAGDKDLLYIVGPCRSGKSRSAYHALKRFLMEGASAEVGQISDMSLARYDEYADIADRLKHCGVLLLDDMDKGVYTERFSQLIFSILDWRITHSLPTLVTANVSIRILEDYISRNAPQFAKPISSRIAEASKVVEVK